MTMVSDTDALRWKAVMDRSSGSVGRFVYGVRSTGIYCTPACPSRLPRRENVVFFEAFEDARKGGFRACLRCNPDRSQAGAD